MKIQGSTIAALDKAGVLKFGRSTTLPSVFSYNKPYMMILCVYVADRCHGPRRSSTLPADEQLWQRRLGLNRVWHGHVDQDLKDDSRFRSKRQARNKYRISITGQDHPSIDVDKNVSKVSTWLPFRMPSEEPAWGSATIHASLRRIAPTVTMENPLNLKWEPSLSSCERITTIPQA